MHDRALVLLHNKSMSKLSNSPSLSSPEEAKAANTHTIRATQVDYIHVNVVLLVLL